MPFGYSNQFVTEVQKKYKAKPTDPVNALCYLCVQQNVMLSSAAEKLGVSKQTVYNWFRGVYQPMPSTVKKIEKLNQQLLKKANKTKA